MSRKGILVIHGMGNPSKNSLLKTVVNAIADWIGKNSKSGTQPSLELDIKKATPDPESDEASRITLKHDDDEWVFQEVWWARLVDAPQYDPMIGWTLVRAFTHIMRLAFLTLVNGFFPILIASALLAFLAGWLVIGIIFLLFVFISVVFVLPFAAILIFLRPYQSQVREVLRYSMATVISLASALAIIGISISLFSRPGLLESNSAITFLFAVVAGIGGAIIVSLCLKFVRLIAATVDSGNLVQIASADNICSPPFLIVCSVT